MYVSSGLTKMCLQWQKKSRPKAARRRKVGALHAYIALIFFVFLVVLIFVMVFVVSLVLL